MNNAAKTPRYNVEEYYQAIQNSEQPTELLDGELVAMASPAFNIKEFAETCNFSSSSTSAEITGLVKYLPLQLMCSWMITIWSFRMCLLLVIRIGSTVRNIMELRILLQKSFPPIAAMILTGSCGFIGFMAFGSTGLLTRSMKKYWFISLRKVRSRTCIRLIRRFRFGFTRMQNIRCQLSFRNCFKCLECIVQ